MADERTRVVVDTSVLINLIHADQLRLLEELPGFEFLVPREVAAEIRLAEQATAIVNLTQRDLVHLVDAGETGALALYAELRARMGSGEAACLAIAATKGWAVASDDQGRAFIRELTVRVGDDALMTTPGVLLLAIRAGLITVDDADAIKLRLEKHRFRMAFGSFRDLH